MEKISVNCGKVTIGNGNVTVQSMTNTKTEDVKATVKQIEELASAGCDIVRVSVNTDKAASAIGQIVNEVTVPIVADIHFNESLAFKAVEAGVHKIRINPGNFPCKDLKALSKLCSQKSVPIRIGVNGGSISQGYKDLPKAEGLVLSMLDCIKRFEDLGFNQLVLSVKSSDVKTTIEVNERLYSLTPYPLHIGVTEAGTYESGIVKNAIGIGSLLLKGIGDTIRVSLSDDPIKEVYAARRILSALNLKQEFTVIACPTCSRTSINVIDIASKLEKEYFNVRVPLKVAVMGCVVNGIGESEGADIGIAGGESKSAIFMNGEIVETVPNEQAYDVLKKYINLKINGRTDDER